MLKCSGENHDSAPCLQLPLGRHKGLQAPSMLWPSRVTSSQDPSPASRLPEFWACFHHKVGPLVGEDGLGVTSVMKPGLAANILCFHRCPGWWHWFKSNFDSLGGRSAATAGHRPVPLQGSLPHGKSATPVFSFTCLNNQLVHTAHDLAISQYPSLIFSIYS